MEMDQSQPRSSSNNQNSKKTFCKQPITCPWVTAQPYPSALNKNRACESSVNKSLPNIPLSMESRTINEKTCPSLQHSSSQFFYFLRLMQLFPETHPATLHTVLSLCKNDFFCAVDKLLYAKRCKALHSRSQNIFKRCSVSRSHPYCSHSGLPKNCNQTEKIKCNEAQMQGNIKDAAVVIVSKEINDNNIDIASTTPNMHLGNHASTDECATQIIPVTLEAQKNAEDLSSSNTLHELMVNQVNKPTGV